MQAKEFMQSNTFRVSVLVLGILLIALISFGAGVKVGVHKVRFSAKWGENYERNFMGKERGPGMFMEKMRDRGFRNGHGVAGEILSVSENSLLVKDRDGKENTVTITEKTLIKHQNDTLALVNLKTSDRITVIGKPDANGTVTAEFIRVFDPAIAQ